MSSAIGDLLDQAVQRLQSQQPAEALELMECSEASAIRPPNYHYIRALCLLELKRYDEALIHLHQELSLYPENVEAEKLLVLFSHKQTTSEELSEEELICKHGIVSFSQTGEDVLLLHLLGNRPSGRYVDIGAFHPIVHSNTFMYYHLGWSGINIDATPGAMDRFKLIRPRDVNVNVGIAAEEAELEYYMFNNPEINSFDRELSFKRDQDDKGFPDINISEIKNIRVRPLADVLAEHIPPGTPIDFFSIDVEGKEIDVLSSNDWYAYRPDFLILEQFEKLVDIKDSEVAKFVGFLGYEPVVRTKASCIYQRIS